VVCFNIPFKVILYKCHKNRILRKVFGPKREKVTGYWGKLHKEEFSDLYSLPNIVPVVKSRRLSWAGHVARMARGELRTGFWWGSLREGVQWGDPNVHGRIILSRKFRKWERVFGTEWRWFSIGTGGEHL